MPVISVVMSVFKENELSVRKAVDSILQQTFKDFEFIIIIDNPDNKEAIDLIESYSHTDPRVKYVVHEKNKGLAAALNYGIQMATGEYIARQDTEDASLPGRFRAQYDYMQLHKDVHVLGTAIRYFDEKGNIKLERRYQPVVGDEIKKYNPLAHPTLLIRKSAYYDFGFYQEGLYNEDYDLWMRWYIQGVKMHNLQDSYYDYHQDDIAKRNKAKFQLKVTIEIKSKHARDLNYKFGDYLYLYAQKIILLFPSYLIVRFYYIYNNYLGSKK